MQTRANCILKTTRHQTFLSLEIEPIGHTLEKDGGSSYEGGELGSGENQEKGTAREAVEEKGLGQGERGNWQVFGKHNEKFLCLR